MKKRMSQYTKTIAEETARGYQEFITNVQRADAAFAIEQGMRAIDRVKLALCSEHGCPKIRCAAQWHAHVHNEPSCWCGLPVDQHVDPKRDFRPRPVKS